MRFLGYPYNDLVICKDSPDYLTDLPCVPNDDNSLDARIHEMRWCTPRARGGL